MLVLLLLPCVHVVNLGCRVALAHQSCTGAVASAIEPQSTCKIQGDGMIVYFYGTGRLKTAHLSPVPLCRAVLTSKSFSLLCH
jgi:hypothetical protein